MGAIFCATPGPRVRHVAIYSFPSPTHLAGFWPRRLRDIPNLPAEWGEDACVNGDPAVGTWAEGDIVCYIDRGVAKIRWTDDRSGLYGVVDGTSRDLSALFAWWRSNAQRLGIASWAD
jgi:hypothetical protein